MHAPHNEPKTGTKWTPEALWLSLNSIWISDARRTCSGHLNLENEKKALKGLLSLKWNIVTGNGTEGSHLLMTMRLRRVSSGGGSGNSSGGAPGPPVHSTTVTLFIFRSFGFFSFGSFGSLDSFGSFGSFSFVDFPCFLSPIGSVAASEIFL